MKWSIKQGNEIIYEITENECLYDFPKNTGNTDMEYTINLEDEYGCIHTTTMMIPKSNPCRKENCTSDKYYVFTNPLDTNTFRWNGTKRELEIVFSIMNECGDFYTLKDDDVIEINGTNIFENSYVSLKVQDLKTYKDGVYSYTFIPEEIFQNVLIYDEYGICNYFSLGFCILNSEDDGDCKIELQDGEIQVGEIKFEKVALCEDDNTGTFRDKTRPYLERRLTLKYRPCIRVYGGEGKIEKLMILSYAWGTAEPWITSDVEQDAKKSAIKLNYTYDGFGNSMAYIDLYEMIKNNYDMNKINIERVYGISHYDMMFSFYSSFYTKYKSSSAHYDHTWGHAGLPMYIYGLDAEGNVVTPKGGPYISVTTDRYSLLTAKINVVFDDSCLYNVPTTTNAENDNVDYTLSHVYCICPTCSCYVIPEGPTEFPPSGTGIGNGEQYCDENIEVN